MKKYEKLQDEYLTCGVKKTGEEVKQMRKRYREINVLTGE